MRTFFVLSVICSLHGCGGSGGATEQIQENTSHTSVGELNLENGSDQQSATVSSTNDSDGEPSTDTNFQLDDETIDTAEPDSSTSTNDSTEESQQQLDNDIQQEPIVESPSRSDIYGQIPFCEQAGQRILASVEIGMTAEEVRNVVGKPLSLGTYGTYWEFSRRSSTPEIRFQPVFDDSRSLGPGLVTGWDSQTDGCDNNDDALIEAANALMQESSGGDRSDQVGECSEAGIRILAYVELGMAPEEVRALVGKPIEIDGSGTYWEYGESTFTPEVRFTPVAADGLLTPGVVMDYEGYISSCP